MSNVNEIIESYLCYGCGACNVVCAKDAITMEYDNIGRLQPKIDTEKCTNCGLCKKICPSIDLKGIQFPVSNDPFVGEVTNTYIGKANDDVIFRNSQSGGLVTSILKYLFETEKIDGAILCKVSYGKEYVPQSVIVKSVKELYDCQKSSYVPIDMVSTVKELEDLKSIAVVGTGCHIQGFMAICDFKKIYREKIKYKLGLICDRTLCKTITDVLSKNIFDCDDKKLIWRDKSQGYKNARLIIKSKDGRQKVLPTWYRFLLKDPFTNPRCRICFDKLNVHSDVVLGDPWGMSNVDWKLGSSVILTRTEQGECLIKEMKDNNYIELDKAPIEELINGQFIKQRKETVAVALSLFLEKGWQIPSYGKNLLLNSISPYRKILDEQLNYFVVNSKKTKEEIILGSIKYLRKARVKSVIFRLLYPILRFKSSIIKWIKI